MGIRHSIRTLLIVILLMLGIDTVLPGARQPSGLQHELADAVESAGQEGGQLQLRAMSFLIDFAIPLTQDGLEDWFRLGKRSFELTTTNQPTIQRTLAELGSVIELGESRKPTGSVRWKLEAKCGSKTLVVYVTDHDEVLFSGFVHRSRDQARNVIWTSMTLGFQPGATASD